MYAYDPQKPVDAATHKPLTPPKKDDSNEPSLFASVFFISCLLALLGFAIGCGFWASELIVSEVWFFFDEPQAFHCPTAEELDLLKRQPRPQ